jgi:SPP1 gp7 family putative phage head morphogenesis protein
MDGQWLEIDGSRVFIHGSNVEGHWDGAVFFAKQPLDGRWVTIKGRRVFIRKGEKPGEAIEGSKRLGAYMQEYKSKTQQHPFDPRQRLLGNVGMEVSIFDRKIHLSSIISYGNKGSGEGTKGLNFLKGLADKHGVQIEGTAKAIPLAGARNKASLTTPQLKKWYKKHGFEIGAGDSILYTPEGMKFEEEQHDHAVPEEYAQVKRDLDLLENKAKEALQEAIRDMRDKLEARIKRGNTSVIGVLPEDKLPYFGEFRGALTEMLRLAHQLGDSHAKQEVMGSADHAGSFTPKAALKWLREKEIFVSGVFSKGLLDGIKNILINALKVGAQPGDTVERLYDLFEPYLGNPDVVKDGVPPEPHKLNTMVRTVTTEAYNHGRLTEYLDPDMLPYLLGVRYSAILDERTTEVCRYLDGRVFKPTDPDLMALTPPNHFNCRSILVPVVVGSKVEQKEFITPAQKGKAKGLADQAFLKQEE